jgi:hypothetical protein
MGEGLKASGYGPYAGIAAPIAAPVPQYWLADATLFIGSAANAAHVLGVEEGMNLQAPQVLGDQTAFLLAATSRALASLMQLQQHAQSQDPSAVPSLRTAVGQLIAARASATQAADAVNAGILGPTFTTNVRAVQGHLAAAEREMQNAGRAFGAQQLAASGVCSANRGAAFGAGVGGNRGQQKGGQQQKGGGQQQQQQQPQK